jgi:glucokinase
MEANESWKTKTLIIGAIIGTLTGLGAAYLIIQRAQVENTQPKLTAGEGVKIGLGVLTLLRLIADIGGGK